MKRISVKLVGSGAAPYTIHVTPAMTAGEVLASLNLEGSVLPIPPSPILYFAPGDAVYDKLRDGDFLLVIPKDLSTIDLPTGREDLHQLLGIADEKPWKRLQVRVHHSTHPPFKLRLRPHTRVSDVLGYLNLPDEDYVLQPLSDPQKHYTSTEVLYDLIESDAKLIATLSPEAVQKYANTFLP